MGREVEVEVEGASIMNQVEESTEVAESHITAAVEVTPVDEDAGMTIIDTMVAGEGETLFSVSKAGKDGIKYKSYLAFKFGTTLAEMVELIGEEIVFDYAKSAAIVKAQAVTRPIVGQGLSAIETIKSWIPGVKRVAAPVDKKAVANDFIANASTEELEAMLAAIKGQM